MRCNRAGLAAATLISLLLYYITDRTQLADEEAHRRRRLLDKIAEAASAGVDYIQLRERDLTVRELERLAIEAIARVRTSTTRLLINSRVDVALAIDADGVHLRSHDLAASEARAIWGKSTGRTNCVIGVSCHSLNQVLSAEAHGADFAVFGPVFGKQGSNQPPIGMDALEAVASRGNPVDKKVEAGQTLGMPVLALGGVTLENARACVEAGAAGVAGIRLFQESDIARVVARLR
jgi:thiamine-phosphate pyrophosphorylase